MIAKYLLFFAAASNIFIIKVEDTDRVKPDTPSNCRLSVHNQSLEEKSGLCENSPKNSSLKMADEILNSEQKIKIAIIGSIAIGHITPTIDIVRTLKSKGYEIVYYAPIYTKNLIESTGARFIAYPEQKQEKMTPSEKKDFKLNESGLLLLSLFGSYTNYIMLWLLENFKNEHFDVVIYSSLTLWGNALASYLKIPYLCHGISVLPAEEEAWINTHLYDEGKEKQLEFANELHRQYNTTEKTFTEIISCTSAKKVLMFSSQNFLEAAFGQSFSVPEKYIFLNPSSLQASQNFINEIKENSIIYLSLGTAFNNRQDIFEAIINFFRGTKYELIVSTGNNEKLYQTLMSKYSSSNVKINLYVNQQKLLKDVAIFITHSGFNSIKEAITNTIPTITIPQGADQFLISRAITNLKIGVSVEDYEGSFEDKFKAAFLVIEQNFLAYKKNLKNAQKHLFDGPSFEESVTDLEDYLFNITNKQ